MLGRSDPVVAEFGAMQAAQQVLASPAQGRDGPVPAFGPADARITVVEFSDFECLDCGRASPMARVIRNLHGDRVRCRPCSSTASPSASRTASRS